MKICLPEYNKIVTALAPVTTNSATEGDYVSLRNAKRCSVVVSLTQAATHATAITIEQATVVAGTDSKAISVVVPIWANEDVATTDTLVRQTDAVSYTVDTAATNKLVIFQIDPSTLDVANGFDCINVQLAASSEATNFVSANYFLEAKYGMETGPSAIVDITT